MTSLGEFVRRELRVDPQLVVRSARRTEGHDRGMAELAKNSYGAYLNIEAPPEERVIVFLLLNGNRNERRPTRVACLDFVGMSESDFRVWEDWGNPDAAGVVAGALAGHGTGGKAYMWNMFQGDAYLLSVKDNYRNTYGFQGADPRSRIVPGRFGVANMPVTNAIDALDEQLVRVCGLSFEHLPDDAQRIARRRNAFTLVVGEDPKEVNRSTIPASRWIDRLKATGQMFQVLESSRIYVFHNGNLMRDAAPILRMKLEEVDSTTLPIPEALPDPQTEIEVPTEAEEGSTLILRMCSSDLVRGRQGFNRIFYWADGAMRGETPLRDFTASGWGRRIYGELYLDTLNPTCVSEERLDLVDNPLSRSVRRWVREKVEEYVDQFDKVEQREEREEDRRRNVEIMEAFNEWKNQFLDQLLGLGGQGTGRGGVIDRGTRTSLPRGEVARIRIVAEADLAGVDVTLPFTVQFFDANDQRVRPVPTDWEISDWNVCGIDQEVGEIRTYAPGIAVIALRTNQGICSNEVLIKVLNLRDIEIQDVKVEIRQGERRLLHARCTDRDGDGYTDVRLVWVSNDSSIAEVGEHGFVTGISPGETQIYAMDGRANSLNSANVRVAPVGGESRAYPELLLSEEQKGPYEQPAVLRPREGPVVQRAQDVDYNIWWMNKRSALADHILSTRGVDDPMWLQYVFHCFAEMIARIMVQRRVETGEIELSQWQSEWEGVMTDVHYAAQTLIRQVIEEGDLSMLTNRRSMN